MSWTSGCWLVAIRDEVPADEIRRWWNAKETPLLDDLVMRAPRIWLGQMTNAIEEALPSPTGRVHALLFLRGTLHEYVVPVLDEELITEILAAFQPRDDDNPKDRYGALAEVTAFLTEHRGVGVLTDEDCMP
ncbi:hypothetical protein IMZ11_01850 [Microtetraspora sp. AC03309]|uniref:hypothetical protein n=1 Tax=Microtetraspora sp. AC03309 TaxID=2779376 RepID=UPI001E37246A|nr:hypothetical protein [Microtetraspora sp. AC03309]MCC5574383.1 hypothetical protein [Microtetraspora sp. AC03309]